jgi:hypothetical protein
MKKPDDRNTVDTVKEAFEEREPHFSGAHSIVAQLVLDDANKKSLLNF